MTRRGALFGIAAFGVLALACCGLLPAVVVLVRAAGRAALLGGAILPIVAAGRGGAAGRLPASAPVLRTGGRGRAVGITEVVLTAGASD